MNDRVLSMGQVGKATPLGVVELHFPDDNDAYAGYNEPDGHPILFPYEPPHGCGGVLFERLAVNKMLAEESSSAESILKTDPKDQTSEWVVARAGRAVRKLILHARGFGVGTVRRHAFLHLHGWDRLRWALSSQEGRIFKVEMIHDFPSDRNSLSPTHPDHANSSATVQKPVQLPEQIPVQPTKESKKGQGKRGMETEAGYFVAMQRMLNTQRQIYSSVRERCLMDFAGDTAAEASEIQRPDAPIHALCSAIARSSRKLDFEIIRVRILTVAVAIYVLLGIDLDKMEEIGGINIFTKFLE